MLSSIAPGLSERLAAADANASMSGLELVSAEELCCCSYLSTGNFLIVQNRKGQENHRRAHEVRLNNRRYSEDRQCLVVGS